MNKLDCEQSSEIYTKKNLKETRFSSKTKNEHDKMACSSSSTASVSASPCSIHLNEAKSFVIDFKLFLKKCISLASLLKPSGQTIILLLGIYICFIAFGYYQELVFRLGTPNDPFRFPVFLVFSLSLTNVFVSGAILFFEHQTNHILFEVEPSPIDDTLKYHHLKAATEPHKKSKFLEKTSFWRKYIFDIKHSVLFEIALSSLTYILSMLCTNYALAHVNYPTQVLVKSAKTVPVVLGGFIFFNKRYPLYDYLCVASVTTFLILFNFSAKPQPTKTANIKNGHHQQTSLGLLFLAGSLLCDSLTGPRQDRLFTQVKITSTHMMFLTNIFATVIGFIILCCAESISAVINFIYVYPEAMTYIVYFCLSAAFGQIFIFGSLTTFGSLQLTLLTTTRKFFTVVFSILAFGHSLTKVQWISVLVIFLSLMLQAILKKRSKMQTKEKIT